MLESQPGSENDAAGSTLVVLDLPEWCTRLGSESEEEDAECHICRLTAEESAEELVVPCACVTMPVHPTCRECSAPLHRLIGWVHAPRIAHPN